MKKLAAALLTAILMPGGPVADAVLQDVTDRVAKLATEGRGVGLATILVGDDPASAGYVAKKHEACERCRIFLLGKRRPRQLERLRQRRRNTS